MSKHMSVIIINIISTATTRSLLDRNIIDTTVLRGSPTHRDSIPFSAIAGYNPAVPSAVRMPNSKLVCQHFNVCAVATPYCDPNTIRRSHRPIRVPYDSLSVRDSNTGRLSNYVSIPQMSVRFFATSGADPGKYRNWIEIAPSRL